MIASDLDAIPLPRWLLWNTETRKGRATKMPHQIDGITASSTDAPKWFEFWPVTKGRRPNLFNGIGVVSGDAPDGPHLGGIDVDSCVDDRGGSLPGRSPSPRPCPPISRYLTREPV